MIHALDDKVVGIEEGERIFAAARQPKGFHPPIGADRLVSDRGASERLLSVVRGWFETAL